MVHGDKQSRGCGERGPTGELSAGPPQWGADQDNSKACPTFPDPGPRGPSRSPNTQQSPTLAIPPLPALCFMFSFVEQVGGSFAFVFRIGERMQVRVQCKHVKSASQIQAVTQLCWRIK